MHRWRPKNALWWMVMVVMVVVVVGGRSPPDRAPARSKACLEMRIYFQPHTELHAYIHAYIYIGFHSAQGASDQPCMPLLLGRIGSDCCRGSYAWVYPGLTYLSGRETGRRAVFAAVKGR